MSVRRNWLARAVAAAVVALSFLVAVAVPASAHATLLFATPAVDGTVPTSPPAISLLFDQPVSPTSATLRLQGPGASASTLGPARLRRGGNDVTAAVAKGLRPGVYTVSWQVIARDGDVMAGKFRFAIGTGQGLAATGGQTFTAGFGWTAVFRWALFAAYAIALGALAGSRILRPVSARSGLSTPRPRALGAAVVALAAAIGLAAVVAGAGDPLRGLTQPGALLDSRPGLLALLEMTALALTALALRLSRRTLAGVLLTGVAVVEGVRAHPESAAPGWGALSLTVHLMAVAVWVGALVYVLRTALAWRHKPAAVGEAFRTYARLAAWTFALVIVTGTINALLVTPLDTVLTTTYGRLLLAKLALVGLVSAAALISRLRLRTLPDPGRLARAEAGILATVLAVTAVLTVVSPPAAADAPLPFPPPPSGPVLATGGRAGTIGIAATASNRQLVLHLTKPTVAGEPDAKYQLTANHLPPGGKPRPLRLRGCGPGCYVASPNWVRGANTVTLEAQAPGWQGGKATLLIGWPIRPAPNLLPKIAAEMRDVPRFTLHEQVTSDTTRGPGRPQRLQLTGADFLDTEPYAKGIAPIAAMTSRTRDETTLALGYPGENVSILLTVDSADRIVRETLIAPYHLLQRTFVYPDHGEQEDSHG